MGLPVVEIVHWVSLKFNFSSCNNKKRLSLQVASCSQPSCILKVTADSMSGGGVRQLGGGWESLAWEDECLWTCLT